MKTQTKIILILELIFVVGVIGYFLSIKPIAVAPSSGLVIQNDNFSFEFKNTKKLVLSKTFDFENKIEFKKDFSVDLPPGTYYWKLKSWFRESEVRNFTIYSRVSIKLDEVDGNLMIYNTGNVGVNLTILEDEPTIKEENREVEPGYSTKIENKENVAIEGEEI